MCSLFLSMPHHPGKTFAPTTTSGLNYCQEILKSLNKMFPVRPRKKDPPFVTACQSFVPLFLSRPLIIIAMHWGKGSSQIIISSSANTAQIFPRDVLEIQSPAPTTYSLYDSFCGNTHTIHRHRHGDDFGGNLYDGTGSSPPSAIYSWYCSFQRTRYCTMCTWIHICPFLFVAKIMTI